MTLLYRQQVTKLLDILNRCSAHTIQHGQYLCGPELRVRIAARTAVHL